MIESELRWPVFWSCAIGALAIIVYRNYMRKRKKNANFKTQILHHKTTGKLRIDRSIKEHFRIIEGSMAEQTDEWWKGLGEELETDIEAPTDKTENS